MTEVAGKKPGAVALASLATSPRRGEASSHLPPWPDGAEEAAAGFVLLHLSFFFFFKLLKN